MTAIRQVAAASVSSLSDQTIQAIFPSAPTQGNLLIGFFYTYQQIGVNTGSGWAQLAALFNTPNLRNSVIFAKYCGAAQPATVNDMANSSTQLWGCVLFEVSGVSGVLASDVAQTVIGPNSGAIGMSSVAVALSGVNADNITVGGFCEFALAANPTMTVTGSPSGSDLASATGPTESFGVAVASDAQGFGTGVTAVSQVVADSGGGGGGNDWGASLIELVAPPPPVTTAGGGLLLMNVGG